MLTRMPLNSVEDFASIEQFKHFIQLIGKGQRSGRTLTQQEAYQAMSLLLAEKVTAEQRGAFLMLLRVREETPEEIAGFLQACRKFNKSQFTAIEVDLDMGCYAGKRRHLPWLILSVMCLAQSGKRIVIHGTQEPETERLYVSDALSQIGMQASTTAAQLERQLELLGFGYINLAAINKPLDSLIQLRAQLGLRSCANTLARMLNPFSASVSLQGVYHHHLDFKHAKVAQILNQPSVHCFRGDAGEVEYNPERGCQLHSVHTGIHGITEIPAMNEQWVTKPRALDTQQLKRVWQGQQNDPYGVPAVIGTLALMLMATEQCEWQSAQAAAQSMWCSRNKQWPNLAIF